MKETIYSIPINIAFEKPGCPVCRLKAELEEASLQYIMGAAMMEPDVRLETNRLGFCAGHLTNMLGMRNRLSLALMLESHLDTLRKQLPQGAYKPNCFICHRVDSFFVRYLANILTLFRTQPDFTQKLAQAPLCCPHAAILLQTAKTELPRKAFAAFTQVLAPRLEAETARLGALVSAFCQSFDHRNAGKPLGEAREAVEQTVAWLSGGQIDDE